MEYEVLCNKYKVFKFAQSAIIIKVSRRFFGFSRFSYCFCKIFFISSFFFSLKKINFYSSTIPNLVLVPIFELKHQTKLPCTNKFRLVKRGRWIYHPIQHCFCFEIRKLCSRNDQQSGW